MGVDVGFSHLWLGLNIIFFRWSPNMPGRAVPPHNSILGSKEGSLKSSFRPNMSPYLGALRVPPSFGQDKAGNFAADLAEMARALAAFTVDSGLNDPQKAFMVHTTYIIFCSGITTGYGTWPQFVVHEVLVLAMAWMHGERLACMESIK